MSKIGRYNLFVDEREVNADNIISVLNSVTANFSANAQDCDRLLKIEAGYMPLTRVKTVRPEINVQTVDNLPHEITNFHEGYIWGSTITLVQRGVKDSGSESETEAIDLLNECYSAENIGKKQRALAHFVEICGIGFTYVNIKSDWVDGDSYFELETLDPRFAFVVRSSLYTDHRVILGVTFRVDSNNVYHYSCFTPTKRFEVEADKVVDTGANPIGVIPIIEWERATDRMGVFEREIPEIERINLILSDIGNDIDSECQQVWHANDVVLPYKTDENGKETDEIERPKSGEWIVSETSKDGKTPFIKPLATNYNYSGLLSNYTVARSLVLERTNTPQRNDNSGSSSGTAMSSATGWEAAEQAACAQQLLMESNKLEEVRVALAVIKTSDARVPLDSPLRKLRYIDCKANITRMKLHEMTVKTTALANLLSHGINGLHAIKSVNFFEDAAGVWEDSKDLIEQYQKKTFGEDNETIGASDDPQNQITRSPLIDSMSLQEAKETK